MSGLVFRGSCFVLNRRMCFLLTVKMDPRMKAALKKVAEKQFISVSAAAKQAIEKYLESHGTNWREEVTTKRATKKAGCAR